MENLMMIETAIDYIESHLDEKLDLEKVSEAVHYSKTQMDGAHAGQFLRNLQNEINRL